MSEHPADQQSDRLSEPLTPRSGLAGAAKPGRYGRSGATAGVTITDAGAVAMAMVTARAGQATALSAAVAERFGVALPARPQRVVQGAHAFTWSGPAQWLATSSDDSEFLAELGACAGTLASITDLTGSRALIRVSGARARAGLAKLLPIDLHPRAFRAGDAALTLATHISVHVWQVDDAPTYELACPRSYGTSLWHALTAAVAEYGYTVATPA